MRIIQRYSSQDLISYKIKRMISLGIELVKSFNDRYITMYKTVIKTTEDFKSKAKEIFGDYYDYTKTDILKKDSKRRVIITCPKHGDFLQDMYSHLNGCGCPKCGKENMAKTQSFTKEQFVDKANIVHNFKYKYTTTVYNGATKNVDIICPIHGIFTQKHTHIYKDMVVLNVQQNEMPITC